MNRTLKRTVGLFLVSILMAGVVMAAGEQKPSGTVVIDETQIMWIVGGDIGGGTLHFQGKSYKFKTDGLKLGGFGIDKVKLTGDVYDLKDVADFPGVYGVAELGATVAKAGKGDFVMKNDKGVILHLKAGEKGLALDLGVEGLKITLEKQ